MHNVGAYLLFKIHGLLASNILLECFFFSRAEELETALMEMVQQDNRRQLSAKVYSKLIQTTIIASEYMKKQIHVLVYMQSTFLPLLVSVLCCFWNFY
jgi:hypothetical protein